MLGLLGFVQEALFLYPGMPTHSPTTHLKGKSKIMNVLSPHRIGESVRRMTGWSTTSSWKLLYLRTQGPLHVEASGVFVHAARLPGLFLQGCGEFKSAGCPFPLFYVWTVRKKCLWSQLLGSSDSQVSLLNLSSQRWSFFWCLCLLYHLTWQGNTTETERKPLASLVKL